MRGETAVSMLSSDESSSSMEPNAGSVRVIDHSVEKAGDSIDCVPGSKSESEATSMEPVRDRDRTYKRTTSHKPR